MKLVGICPVRSEDWCIGMTLRAMLQWIDEVVVLLHACTDRSTEIVMEIAREHTPRVTVVADDNPVWDEMRHRQSLLEIARSKDGPNATHIAILDADEILTGNLLGSIRELVSGLPFGAILRLPGYNLRYGTNKYHANGVWGNRWFSAVFPDRPGLGWVGDTFHHREPMGGILGPYAPVQHGAGGIMHLWGTSERRLVAKHRLYKILEHIRWPSKPLSEIDRLYNLALYDGFIIPASQWTFTPVPEEWWAPYRDLMKHLDVEREPWQERESERLIAEYGPEHFRGLDLFLTAVQS